MIRTAMIFAPIAFALSAFTAHAASGRLDVTVDVSEQTMIVSQNGQVLHTWPVSTARGGKVTPRGTFKPQWLSKHHRSSLYNNAPMPNAIFYSGNYAIHGTTDVGKLGSPASAGCVRLSTENSAVLFNHVEANGLGSLTIRVQD